MLVYRLQPAKIRAEGSIAPDSDALTYSWSIYKEPSTFAGAISIKGESDESATINIPHISSEKTIHLVLEIHDDGGRTFTRIDA